VGQADDVIGYLFYNPTTKKITTTMHIRFNEDVTVEREWNESDEQQLLREIEIVQTTDLPTSTDDFGTSSHDITGATERSTVFDPEERDEALSVSTLPGNTGNDTRSDVSDDEVDSSNKQWIPDTWRASTRSGHEYGAIQQVQQALVSGEYIDMHSHALMNTDEMQWEDVTRSADSGKWYEAIDIEIKAMFDRDVWIVKPKAQMPSGRTLVNFKWVFKIKFDEKDTIQKFKARLCAKGFTQREGIDYTETFSPVARHTTFKMLLAIGTAEQFHYRHMDVKTAFLHGILKEKVYMKAPQYVIQYMKDKLGMFKGVDISNGHKEYVLELHKAIYGLKQASREWHHTIDTYIQSLGFTRSRSDPCLYWTGDRQNKIIIMIYVDDVIIAAKQSDLGRVIHQMIQRFPMEDDPLHYYVGREITLNEKYTRVCQANCIKRVFKRANIASRATIVTSMCTQNKLTTNPVTCDDADRNTT
jgi:hypothetical protein